MYGNRNYLHRNLQEASLRVGLVTGATPEADRERLRDRFRLPREDAEALDVLLSSEVGCEGLDYEFCDRLVNYDIPWNPMRIEQRIGRIDRFGQKSPKVLIFNFVTPGTVEDRIYFRCFERLGIFQHTLGDLEEVLGDLVDGLTRIGLDTRLTPDQTEAKAAQLADNTLLRVEELKRLESESGSLLGLEAGFTAEVEHLVAEGRFVSAEDLRQVIGDFLGGAGASLVPKKQSSARYTLHAPKEVRASLRERSRELDLSNRTNRSFVRWLEQGASHMDLTFDQALALEDRKLPFVTPLHPLARLAVAHWQESTEPLVASLRAPDKEGGRFLFVFELWETVGVRKDVRLVSAAWNLDADQPDPAIEQRLPALVSAAEAKPGRILEISESSLRGLESRVLVLRRSALEELQRKNRSTADRQLASLESSYQNRIGRLDADLQKVSEEKIHRMKMSERSRIQAEYRRRKNELETHREVDIVSHRIAMGFLETWVGGFDRAGGPRWSP